MSGGGCGVVTAANQYIFPSSVVQERKPIDRGENKVVFEGDLQVGHQISSLPLQAREQKIAKSTTKKENVKPRATVTVFGG